MPRGKGTKGTNRISVLCLLCLLLAGFISCRNQSPSGLTVTAEITPQPPRVGQATITLRVTGASGQPVTRARVALEGNMSHAGMAPVFADAMEVESGRYQANIELTMAGDWIILVHVTLPGGEKVERQFEVKGVVPA